MEGVGGGDFRRSVVGKEGAMTLPCHPLDGKYARKGWNLQEDPKQ